MKHRISHFKAKLVRSSLIVLIASCLFTGLTQAQTDETVRYTVEKGDTLWGISSRYLENPWLWPELWKENSYIENPNLIFPGDVLLISSGSIRLIRNKQLSNNKQLTTNKLSPQVRSSPSHAITTIDPGVIMPFLTQSIVVESELLDNSPYVLEGIDGKLILGKSSRLYATGLTSSDASEFLLFNKGRIIQDQVTGTVYGTEGVHLGMARLVKHEGDVTELEITRANQDILPGTSIMPIDEPRELPRYFPRRPDKQIDTRVISIPKGVVEAGRWDVVIISGGKQEGLEDGHVLEVFSFRGQIRDPRTSKLVTLPDTKIATLMVFKAYERVSYALLMEASAAVKVGDRSSSPRL